MTNEKLEKAMDLKGSMKTLIDFKRAFYTTYPKILVNKEILVLDRDLGSYTVSFADFDDQTREELMDLIKDYINKRYNQLKEEYDQL